MKIENLCINCMKEKPSQEGKCPYCGFDASAASIPPHHLAPFVILAGKYLVGTAIGEGGFGITYIGMDLNLEMRVAIKEYYPNGCAVRDMSGSSTVQSYSGEQRTYFEAGREKFINEARVMAKFVDLPNIVTVKEFFKENHTAYIVMEYVDGKTLKSYLKEKGGRISAKETLAMMRPVIKALGQVHKNNLIHRDISPDNIMIQKDGTIKLLDFGGARDFGSADAKSLSIMLKPGYAPEEQYRTHGEQGPWTDVYAMCATIYRCISGEIPPEAMDRVYRDKIKPLSSFQTDCPEEAAEAVMKGLSIYKDARFLSMESLYQALYHNTASVPGHTERDHSGMTRPGSGHTGKTITQEHSPQKQSGKSANPGKILPVVASLLGVVIIVFAGIILFSTYSQKKDDSVKQTTTAKQTDVIKEEQNQEKKQEKTNKTAKTPTAAPVPDPTATPTPEPTPTKKPALDTINMDHLRAQLGGRGSGAKESLYVFDLKSGVHKGTENCQAAMPASALISIPILYTTAKKIDNGTLQLNTPVPFEYTYQGGRGFLTAAQNGQAVTVDELLQNMLMYSDNNAINSMINALGMDDINSTCQNAGFTTVNLERKIISTPTDKNNYICTQDLVIMTKALYDNTFQVINRDYLLKYMKIVDKAGRLGIFKTDQLYNNGLFCSQNGIIPDPVNGRYCELGIVLADGQEYILGVMAEGGNSNLSPEEFSDAASYIHSCMTEE